jgi:hypothetical protein
VDRFIGERKMELRGLLEPERLPHSAVVAGDVTKRKLGRDGLCV